MEEILDGIFNVPVVLYLRTGPGYVHSKPGVCEDVVRKLLSEESSVPADDAR
jgi:hypothetical protein